jgi:hypothetical protein
MTLNLTINHSNGSSETQTACDKYTWQLKTYTMSGIYKDTVTNWKGCDSILTLNLTIKNSTSSSEVQTACDKYIWMLKTYTASGIYKDTIPNFKGCDSVLSLNLTIKQSTTSTQVEKACNTYTWNGTVYNTSGMYKDTIPNTAGCDSLMVLNLTINKSTTSTETVNACGPHTWNGSVYTKSGTYNKTITNKAGCDSVMILNLTITNLNATVTVTGQTITADSVGVTYQWINCTNGNTSIPGATGQSFTPPGSGSYAVIETKNGCMSTSICTAIVVTGIKETETNPVRVYPNPGNGLYTITLPEQAQIKIVSLTGAVVFDQRISKGDHTLDLLNITNGVYMVQVYTNETVTVLKLIKQD